MKKSLPRCAFYGVRDDSDWLEASINDGEVFEDQTFYVSRQLTIQNGSGGLINCIVIAPKSFEGNYIAKFLPGLHGTWKGTKLIFENT